MCVSCKYWYYGLGPDASRHNRYTYARYPGYGTNFYNTSRVFSREIAFMQARIRWDCSFPFCGAHLLGWVLKGYNIMYVQKTLLQIRFATIGLYTYRCLYYAYVGRDGKTHNFWWGFSKLPKRIISFRPPTPPPPVSLSVRIEQVYATTCYCGSSPEIKRTKNQISFVINHRVVYHANSSLRLTSLN